MSLTTKTKHSYILESIEDIPQLFLSEYESKFPLQRLISNATYTFKDKIKCMELVLSMVILSHTSVSYEEASHTTTLHTPT